MRTVVLEPRFEAWRTAARQLLSEGVPPDALLWSEDARETSLFDGPAGAPRTDPAKTLRVPSAFLRMAESACAHTDPRRWAVLYRVLWRLTRGGEPALLSNPTDDAVRQVQEWCKAVGRDVHKMHAFVRFRLVGRHAETDREQFVAWFEPTYRIERLAAPFFQKRFTGMDWSILTPFECAHWDGHRLHFTPGVPRTSAPDGDSLDALWRTYYRSIFNPARVKVAAMQSEMPKKYWKNLPEADLIRPLLIESPQRVQTMLESPESAPQPAPHNAYLARLRAANASPSPASPPPSPSA
ncbi:MAG: hypothetical protein RLZZ142_1598 [Verrucomicrobiota bacterium]|jgi:DNA polymerase